MSVTQRDRVLELLSDGGWHSTRELMDELGMLRPGARVFELRRQGHTIETRERRRGVHEYRLLQRAGGRTASRPPAPQLPLEAFCFECASPAAGQASGQWWCETHLAEELGR